MKSKVPGLFSACLLLLHVLTARACIWDADTLLQERFRSRDMASVILKNPPRPADPEPLRKRIQELQTNRKENDAAWWNDLAGAHLRLGEARTAAELLESVTNRFANDYGIHANLGTAYHLLGRYVEAEREIARDLEINPDAHFGLEKYHLALLQYLVRDAAYQKEHVYVDEWTRPFFERGVKRLRSDPPKLDANELKELGYDPPPYRFKWDLARDEKFRDGVIYMATLNPKEPACFVMLGVACLRKNDLNLAVSAFERAIKLGSPQSEMLRQKVVVLRDYIWQSHKEQWSTYGVAAFLALVLAVYGIVKIRKGRRRKIAISI